MRILFAGIMGRYPYGGVCWCSLMYILGLQKLGHEVLYLEDTGECNFDPYLNTLAESPEYALKTIDSTLRPFALENSWCYIDFRGGYHGRSREELREYCLTADLFINLSGGAWFWRDEYLGIPRRIFIDSDPAFTQLAIEKGPEWYRSFFERFTRLFTFGSAIGTPLSIIPCGSFEWQHTWQPVVLSEWLPIDDPSHMDRFSTIMSWTIQSFSDIGGNKDHEFLKILDIPSHTKATFDLAVTGPRDLLLSFGWGCRDALSISHHIFPYRDFIRSSFAEFSVAKQTYVETRSGWFSDRSECYLAAGRPVVVQDTGFSAHIPVGEGILPFKTKDEALAALESVMTEYPKHSRRAHELARTLFDSTVVLTSLLERASV